MTTVIKLLQTSCECNIKVSTISCRNEKLHWSLSATCIERSHVTTLQMEGTMYRHFSGNENNNNIH